VTRSQQLAAAAAAVEESVCEIARAAVAAVTAQATGKDTSFCSSSCTSCRQHRRQVLLPVLVLCCRLDLSCLRLRSRTSEDLPACASDPLRVPLPLGPHVTCGQQHHSQANATSGRSSSSSCSSGSPARAGAAAQAVQRPSLVPAANAGPGCYLLAVLPSLQWAAEANWQQLYARVAASSSPHVQPAAQPQHLQRPAWCLLARGKAAGSQLEGIDIAGLIGQLSLKKDEGMVDDKLIRDLQIIQSLIGALEARSASGGLEGPGAAHGTQVAVCTSPSPACGSRSNARSAVGSRTMAKRSNSYSPSSAAALNAVLPL